MPAQTQINPRYISASDAMKSKKNSEAAKKIGQATTDRGTLITKSNGGFDKNSFLKILSAQLSNLDPTANQDSTAYVTQMAQFAAMEQMYNLNETMSTSSYQQLIGKGVTMDIQDDDNIDYTGIVRGVNRQNGAMYLSVEVNENGKNVLKIFDATKIKSVLGVPDYTNRNMLINSDFSSASSLAANENNRAIILTTNEKGEEELIKGKIKSAFIDHGIVKIRLINEKNGETEVYSYSSILKAGDLTDEDMNVKLEDIQGTIDNSDKETKDTNETNQTGKEEKESFIESQTGFNKSKITGEDIANQQKALGKIEQG